MLGREPARIVSTIMGLPREQRVAGAEKILGKAKKEAKLLAAKNHPDTGGDAEKFKQIWEAVRVIEEWTAGYKVRMCEYEAKMNKPREGFIVFK